MVYRDSRRPGRGRESGRCETVRINEEARLQALKVGFLRSSAEAMGCKEARRRIGVNATGLAFNSVTAVELNEDSTMNSMVNANGGENADGADGKCGH